MFVILFLLSLLALRFRRICSQRIFSVSVSLIKKLATTRLSIDSKGAVCFFKPTINNSPSSFASHLDYTASRTERRFFTPSPSFRLLFLFYTFSTMLIFLYSLFFDQISFDLNPNHSINPYVNVNNF